MFVFQPRLKPLEKDIEIVKGGMFEVEIEKSLHLKNVYKAIYMWLQDHGYYDAEIQKSDKWETLYYEIKKANGLMFHHMWWRVLKNPRHTDGKVFRYFIKINYQTLAMSKHETMLDGKKFKTYKGDLILRMKAWLQLDPSNSWDTHPIIKHFQPIIIRRWLKKRIDEEKKALYLDLVELQRTIKQLLGGKLEVGRGKSWMDEITGI
jgi:hypothetical protein